MDLVKLFSGELLNKKEIKYRNHIANLICEVYEKTDVGIDRNDKLCNFKKLRTLPEKQLIGEFFKIRLNGLNINFLNSFQISLIMFPIQYRKIWKFAWMILKYEILWIWQIMSIQSVIQLENMKF